SCYALSSDSFRSSKTHHCLVPLFVFSRSGHHRTLHSFPTRRSSDLVLLDRRVLLRDYGGELLASLPDARVRRVPMTEVATTRARSEEHTSELQSRVDLVCRLLLEKKKKTHSTDT